MADQVAEKCFEVELMAICTVFVRGADSQEQAIEYAENEVSFGAFQVMEVRANELTTEREIDASCRHADVRSEGDA